MRGALCGTSFAARLVEANVDVSRAAIEQLDGRQLARRLVEVAIDAIGAERSVMKLLTAFATDASSRAFFAPRSVRSRTSETAVAMTSAAATVARREAVAPVANPSAPPRTPSGWNS
ncbi:MAG TPA: hypothetical protein VN858_06525 [Casimicrobiaceae bacterium]|nr:hypothetical protein [Casimicrobiaceae bacterium]